MTWDDDPGLVTFFCGFFIKLLLIYSHIDLIAGLLSSNVKMISGRFLLLLRMFHETFADFNE